MGASLDVADYATYQYDGGRNATLRLLSDAGYDVQSDGEANYVSGAGCILTLPERGGPTFRTRQIPTSTPEGVLLWGYLRDLSDPRPRTFSPGTGFALPDGEGQFYPVTDPGPTLLRGGRLDEVAVLDNRGEIWRLDGQGGWEYHTTIPAYAPGGAYAVGEPTSKEAAAIGSAASASNDAVVDTVASAAKAVAAAYGIRW